jgi:formylglycine-generating enzyme required for sulfatase activity
MSLHSRFYLVVLLASLFGTGLPCQSVEDQGKKPPRAIENSIGMKLVLIPPGKFTMGSPKDEKGRNKDEEQREVEIKKAFHLGIHEVTQEQFEKLMGFNPSYFSARATGKKGADYESWSKPGGGKDKVKGLGSTSDFPVENVSFGEAVEFCKNLSALPPERKAGRSYRLPSEAEWEYACRGGAACTQVFHFGNSLSSEQANFRGTMPFGGAAKGPWLERTCKVGSYQPNAFGLYDMHGNVWEWCMDSYEYEGDRGFRVWLGGSWGEGGAMPIRHPHSSRARRSSLEPRFPARYGSGRQVRTSRRDDLRFAMSISIRDDTYRPGRLDGPQKASQASKGMVGSGR